MTHKGTVTLETERLILRQISLQDAHDVFVWMSDPEVCRYEHWQPHTSVEWTGGYIREVFDYSRDDLYWWGIEYDKKLIGYVCVVEINENDKKAQLGYGIARMYWSNGFATEAVRVVLDFMFLTVCVNRIEASHSVNNGASGKVLRKAGFALEGHAKQYYYCNDGVQDSNLYAILAEDYIFANMETTIRTTINGDSQEIALDFVTHLRSLKTKFERGGGYWADKNYYIARHNGEAVCFILINGDETNGEPLGFILWSDDSPNNSYTNTTLDVQTKKVAWQHVDICGNCGGCGNPGGSHKTIFGKEFDNVCITIFSFDNPNAEEIECVKKLIEMRIKNI
jgi:ribosomal-protein-alanine N-acetyltransferase